MSSNKPNLKCVIIKSSKERDKSALERASSNALGDDPFEALYGNYQVIEPPYDLATLSSLDEMCGELRPSIDAMVTNIEKLGHRIVPRDNTQSTNENVSSSIKKEIAVARNFFDNAILDQDIGTFTEFRSRLRVDLEKTGCSFIEVIPSLNDPLLPAGLNHLPSWTMRLRRQDLNFTQYEVPRPTEVDDGQWVMKMYPTAKRFRQFVQIRDYGIEGVFFKEWGDPRIINNTNGEVADENLPIEKRAHEVIYNRLYTPKSPYGLPRTIGSLFSIFGNRAAEEINYTTFENNQIPAMALLATNVAVTDGSIARLKEFIEERVQGNKNYATIVLIEGEPTSEAMRDPGSMKMELKPLSEFQHSDAMFQKYMEGNDARVRRSFRIPRIFTGSTEDINRATSEASRKLAEEQIFSPERSAIDDILTNTLIARLGLPNVRFLSNKPSVTDNYELTQLLATAERSGGMTPRIGRLIIEDILGMDLPDISPEIEQDLPFSWTMLKAELQAQAQAANTTTQATTKVRKLLKSWDTIEESMNRILKTEELTSNQVILFRELLTEISKSA